MGSPVQHCDVDFGRYESMDPIADHWASTSACMVTSRRWRTIPTLDDGKTCIAAKNRRDAWGADKVNLMHLQSCGPRWATSPGLDRSVK